MGGKSPIFDLTQAQAEALEQKLNAKDLPIGDNYKVFVSMRYWNPMSNIVAKKVKKPRYINKLSGALLKLITISNIKFILL